MSEAGSSDSFTRKQSLKRVHSKGGTNRIDLKDDEENLIDSESDDSELLRKVNEEAEFSYEKQSYFAVFQFATTWDVIMFALGMACSIIQGNKVKMKLK